MQAIKLTRGFEALVEDADYERINSRNWFASVGVQVRAARCSLRKMIYMQHEVLEVISSELKAKGLEIDHKDRNPLNNQRSNLRIVTREINMRNTIQSLNRIGISFNYRVNSWFCYLDIPGRPRKNLGYRKSREEALALVAEARNASYQDA